MPDVNCKCWDDEAKRYVGPCQPTQRLPCCNLMVSTVYEWILKEARRGKYLCVVAGIPCNGYCVARFDPDGGARPLRDSDHLMGLPGLCDNDRRSLALSNALTVRALALCTAVWEAGGEVLIENPPDCAPGSRNPRHRLELRLATPARLALSGVASARALAAAQTASWACGRPTRSPDIATRRT